MLMMNCLEFLPIYFGVLKAGCIVRSDELPIFQLRDQVLPGPGGRRGAGVRTGVHQPHGRDQHGDPAVRMLFFVGKDGPAYTEDCLQAQ
jgi:hypothetical protein